MKKLSKKMFMFFIIAVAVLLFSLFLYTRDAKRDHYDNKQGDATMRTIILLSDQQTAEFLRNDKDQYVKKMSKPDLFARQAKTNNDYIKIISDANCCMTFNPQQRDKLIRCTDMADKFFATSQRLLSNYLTDSTQVAQIPWKLALVCDKYEEGLPHTREDVIFLSPDILKQTDNELVSTLIHEKVHIFQRQNKEYMDTLVQTLGYRIASSANDPKYILKRSNPDINDTVYINPENGKEMIFIYKSEKPESIDEVFKDQIMEHPYEKMAYDIANKYLQQYLKDIVKNL